MPDTKTQRRPWWEQPWARALSMVSPPFNALAPLFGTSAPTNENIFGVYQGRQPAQITERGISPIASEAQRAQALNQTWFGTPTAPAGRGEQLRTAQQSRQPSTAPETGGTATSNMGGGIPLPQGLPQTYTDANGSVMQWNPYTGSYVQVGFDPSGVYQPPQQTPSITPQQTEENRIAQLQLEMMQNWYAEQARLREEELQQEMQMAQWQQQQQEQAYRAQLAANPMSWLQYSAYTNETPVVQPWMVPLGQNAGLQAGQALPGWNPSAAQGQPMSGLSQLTTPSAQYLARMGPTAQKQYLGYEQSRTGAIPEESQFRLRAGAPPGGRNTGLRWLR